MEKDIDRSINERLGNAIRAVIDQQLEERDPPETLETFERLMEEGFSNEEAYGLIGQLISMEIAEEIAGESGFDFERYVEALENLPEPFTKPRKSYEDDY